MSEKIKIILRNNDSWENNGDLKLVVNESQLAVINRIMGWIYSDNYTLDVIRESNEWEDMTE